MILQTNGIDHLNLRVRNLSESVKFYKDLFGFEVLKEQPEYTSKIIGNDRVKLCLYETENFQEPDKTNFSHFGIHIENFKDVVDRCRELNIKIEFGGAIGWEKSNSVYIFDPNGYEIEMVDTWGGGLG